MRKNISVFLTFSILAVFVSMISTVSAHTPTPTKSPTPTKTPSPTKTPKPTESPKPTHTPKPTPAQSEPPYPACTNGTVVKTFGRFTSKDNHENKEKTIKFTLPSTFVPRNGTVIVLQGEGHAWDKGYPVLSGPKSAITGFPSNAKEFQPKEIAAFSAGQDKNALSPIGTFIDHSPGAGTLSTDQDNITTSYTFAFGTLKAGKNYLKVRHIDTGHEDESDSVFVKGVICADPEPTKVPTDLTNTPTMTPTETPVASESATPTLSPTPTVTEEPTETPEPTETLEPTETETPTPTETVVPTSTTAPTDTLTPTLTPSITLTPTPTPIACIEGPVWTAGVVSSTQGVKKDGTPVAFDRSNPYTVEGPADSVFFTLGGHGQITTIFDRKIQNLPGNDFTVYEFTFGHLSYPEEDAKVEVSDDGITWFTLPTQVRSNINALGLNSMDFSSTGLSTIQYIRITDQTNFALNTVDGILGGNADGIDIDAIQGLKQVCQ